jgi:hypothetical protein
LVDKLGATGNYFNKLLHLLIKFLAQQESVKNGISTSSYCT